MNQRYKTRKACERGKKCQGSVIPSKNSGDFKNNTGNREISGFTTVQSVPQIAYTCYLLIYQKAKSTNIKPLLYCFP